MTTAVDLIGARRWLLIHGDCLHLDTGIAALADGSVAHVIMDPPYEAEAHTRQRRIKKHVRGGQRGAVELDPLPFAAMTAHERAAISRECGRVAQRWVLTFCQVEAVHAWQQSLTAGGLNYKRTCLWMKPDAQPQLTGDRPGMGYESIVTAHAKGKSRWNGGGKAGVYEFVRNQDHGPKHLRHPTVKPLPLMEALIRDFTDPGDLIVDPYAGSGSTGVAALRLGRRFIGWEVDRAYYERALKRLEDTREQPELTARESFERTAGTKRKQSVLDLSRPFTDEDDDP